MTYLRKKSLQVILSLAILFISYLLCRWFFTGGVVSSVWFIFIIEWPIIAFASVIYYILRRIRISKSKDGFLYLFLGVTNICNAGYGALLLATGSDNNNMTNFWLYFGATGCLGFLILVDIFA
jgi:hypothetical protein